MSLFIVVEGIDGSGKTTFCDLLEGKIEELGYEVLRTEEPTKGPYGRRIKEKLKDKIDPLEAVLLFALDRYFHLKEIKRALQEGKIVILDRYIYSTYAYQGASLEGLLRRPEEYIHWVHEPFIVKEDIAFLIDIPAEIALKRISGREIVECYEKLEFLKKVRENYLRIAKKFGLKILDGRDKPEKLVDIAMRDILAIIEDKKSL